MDDSAESMGRSPLLHDFTNGSLKAQRLAAVATLRAQEARAADEAGGPGKLFSQKTEMAAPMRDVE